MPKDYKQRPRRRRGGSFPVFRLLITGIFIAAFVGFLLFIERAPRRADSSLEGLPQAGTGTVTVPTRTEPAVTQQKAPSTAPAPPRFEFYTLLPEKEVYKPPAPRTEQAAPPKPEARATQTPPAKNANTGSSRRYELQVASLKNAAEADTLRAKLLLLGFKARVQTARVQKQTWHRVRVGPFRERAQADAARIKLKRNSLDSFLIDSKG
jgi:cell division protein FtsN